jgi:hypothetical protein
MPIVSAAAGLGPSGAPGVAPYAEGPDYLTRRLGQTRDASAPGQPIPAPTAELLRTSHPGPGRALPGPVRRRFEAAAGTDLSAIRTHTDATADRLAAAVGARAFTVGRGLYFRHGQFRPETAVGVRLIAHEVGHALQQAASPEACGDLQTKSRRSQPGEPHEHQIEAVAEALLAGQRPRLSGAVPAELLQRDPDNGQDTGYEHPPEQAPYPDERLLAALDEGLEPLFAIGVVGGLRAMERNQPRSYARVRRQLQASHGDEAFDRAYEQDAFIMRLVANSAAITERLDGALLYYSDNEQYAAYDYLSENYYDQYDWSYADIFQIAAAGGLGLGLLGAFIGGDPDEIVDVLIAQADDAQAEQIALEADRAEWAETGSEAVGRAIATKEILFWWDTQVSLAALLEPEYGFENRSEAIAWATTTGQACGVLEIQERWYVYRLSSQYSVDDVLATGFERRTDVVRQPGAAPTVLITTDGVVLTASNTRFQVQSQRSRPEEHLAADLSLLETHGEDMGTEQAFRLFKQATRHLVLANLERSDAALTRELDRFFEVPGLRHATLLNPEAGAELQRDSAALRRHMMQAARLANRVGEEPSERERAELEAALAAIGAIHERDPTAALMVVNNRDAEETGPIEEDDFEDLAAGLQPGDAAWAAIEQIQERRRNIERVQQHLLEDPDAVLAMTAVHETILARFSPWQQVYFELRIGLHSMSELASAIGMTVLELGLLITGTIVGGPAGLVLAGASTALGVGQTVRAFEDLALLEAKSALDFTGELALATPEMVSSARTWAWIGVGLTLLDVGGFVHGAARMARLRSVLASPDLANVLEHTRGNLAEAAEALGTSEQALARRLAAARGAERSRLLGEIQQALEPVASGGRYGYLEWPEGFTPEVLNRMRRALLDDTGDIDRIATALDRFGEPLPRDMLELIKRYNFDSPGLAFSKLNYDAWLRLSSGRGTISDVRYLLHEATEIRALQRRGFEFLPENWERMGRHARSRWHREFHSAYMGAHSEALAAEYGFMSSQIARVTGGRVSLPREVIAAIDSSFSGEDARELVVVGEHLLRDHPSFYSWAARADEIVELPAAARARLDPEALRRTVWRTSGLTRADAVVDGAEPTLRELIAIVRTMPM